MTDLFRAKLKEIVELQDIIKKYDLNYKLKYRKTYNFSKYSLLIVFSRDIHEGDLSIEGAGNKQNNFDNELRNFDKSIKTLYKKSFLNNFGLLFSARENVLNSFEGRLFLTKNVDKISTREPVTKAVPKQTKTTRAIKTKTKRKISPLKLLENFLNRIKNEEKDINEKIFRDYFLYQTASYLTKVLYDSGEIKNDKIIKNINNGLTELKNSINSKEIPENENPKKSCQHC